MDTNQNEVSKEPGKTQEEILTEIYENTKATKNYMKWQLYITLVLVVLPLLASLFILPFAFRSLESTYIAPLQGLQ